MSSDPPPTSVVEFCPTVRRKPKRNKDRTDPACFVIVIVIVVVGIGCLEF